MESAKLRTFSSIRTFSSAAVAISTLLSIIFASWLGGDSLNWQVGMALIALAIGIPHGALDHLITLPRSSTRKMALFIAIYVAIALLSIWAILQWNVVGFILVVVMSSVHFGIGDSAFIRELNQLEGRDSFIPIWAYAPVAGAIPVLLPLVSTESAEALEKVNPALINSDHGSSSTISVILFGAIFISIIALLLKKRYRDILDIGLLSALVLFAPPLVAFATYFGCWHAMRHTARLTSLLPQSASQYQAGKSMSAFVKAVIPGLPALLGTAGFVFVLARVTDGELSSDFLWLSLVTIWALTVPHMMVTAKIDRAALSR
jgi:Brp/Blh family beta-carotene 15,15'-monooxygenase